MAGAAATVSMLAGDTSWPEGVAAGWGGCTKETGVAGAAAALACMLACDTSWLEGVATG